MLAEVKTLQRTEKNTITLVIDSDTGTRYIRKELCGPHPIYAQLQALSHLYLPKIFHVEETRTGVVLIEGFIDGANLAEITLPEKQVMVLMEELCEALVFLHDQGILHRDINPSNLLLPADGHIRLIDFDAAREEKPFLSKQDLSERGKVSKTLIEFMTVNHVLDQLPDENQLSLFDML